MSGMTDSFNRRGLRWAVTVDDDESNLYTA